MQFIVSSNIELGYKEWPEKLHNKKFKIIQKNI